MTREDLLKKAVETASKERCVVRIWTLSERLLLRDILAVCPGPAVISDNSVRLPNGSQVRLADLSRADLYRGERTKLEIVLLGYELNDVIRPCLFDDGGELLIEGL